MAAVGSEWIGGSKVRYDRSTTVRDAYRVRLDTLGGPVITSRHIGDVHRRWKGNWQAYTRDGHCAVFKSRRAGAAWILSRISA